MQSSRGITIFLTVLATPLALLLAWLGILTLPANLLGWFLLIVGSTYLPSGLIYFLLRSRLRRQRSAGVLHEESGDRSFWWVLPGFLVIFFLAPVEFVYLGGAARGSLTMQIIGLSIIALGTLLLIWSQVTLKGYFTGHLQVVETQQLVTGGPFKYVRHPAYAGYLLIGLGIAVGFGSLIALTGLVFLLLPGLFYRMLIEERLLTRCFGDAYCQYSQRTRRILPGIW